MSNAVTKNGIPDVPVLKAALLSALTSGRSRSFGNLVGNIARTLQLSRAQRTYRIGTSANTLFENRLIQARRELVNEGLITYRSGKVKLTHPIAVVDTQGTAVPISGPVSTPIPTPNSCIPDARSTKCFSIRQPFASYVVSGVKTAEFRTWKVKAPIRDLVICSSKTVKRNAFIPGLPYGMAIGMVDIVDCVNIGKEHAWKLVNPRLIKPFPVVGKVSFFKVSDIPEVIPSTPEAYREFVLPHCFRGDEKLEDEMIASLFSANPDKLQLKYNRVNQQTFERVLAGKCGKVLK